MPTHSLLGLIEAKKSFLCVGLDLDPAKLPAGLKATPADMLAFNRAIIEATAPYTVAYKINTAFYEALGVAGWALLEQTRSLLPPGIYAIADAKRGDIGNTARQYARAFLTELDFDALTVNPYMGIDTLEPYLLEPKGDIFVLACTSNPGFADFEGLKTEKGTYLYEEVVLRSTVLGHGGRVHYVAGATRPEMLANVRKLAPGATLLVPGVGAQGGDLAACFAAGYTATGPLLINASRSILYAGSGADFADLAAQEAAQMAKEMGVMLQSL